MTPKQRRIWEAVVERDGGLCCDCGEPGDQVHHVISTRYDGAWDERNMMVLCVKHHLLDNKGAGAHTHAKRLEHLKYLRDRHGYGYSDLGDKWASLIREIENTVVNL